MERSHSRPALRARVIPAKAGIHARAGARTNATRENVGRCVVFRDEMSKALFASYLIRVRLKDETLLADFLHMYAAGGADIGL